MGKANGNEKEIQEEEVQDFEAPEGYERQESGAYWKPENKGDTLKGIIEDVIDGQFGKQYVILTADDGKMTTPSHKGLQSRMVNADKGDQVVIVHTGEIPPKVRGENAAKTYEVFLKKGGA